MQENLLRGLAVRLIRSFRVGLSLQVERHNKQQILELLNIISFEENIAIYLFKRKKYLPTRFMLCIEYYQCEAGRNAIDQVQYRWFIFSLIYCIDSFIFLSSLH